MAEERVLCFERKLLDALGLFQGLSFDTDRYLPAVTSPSNLTYLLRREAENDKRFKQLIPYVLLISGARVLHYQRGKGGEETRLHGLYSIGVGGHLSDQDHDLFSKDGLGYYEGTWRELREEVDIKPLREAAVAVINDDSTEVGMVHFGVVHVVYVDEESAVGRRKGIVAPQFVSIPDAVRTAPNYESWSRFCLENIDPLLRKAERVAVPCRQAV
jgi:predicted NUDIX family phosphoesterase